MKTMPLPNAFAETLRDTLDERPSTQVTIQVVKLTGFPVKADLRESIRFSPCLRMVEM